MTGRTLEDGLDVHVDAGVMTLTLNRPAAGNSLDPETVEKLQASWDRAARDEEIAVIVITGAGDRFFCTGSDLKKTPPPAESFIGSFLHGRHPTITPPIDLRKPVIAAINGMAVGGGLEIALGCDLRIASANAEFGLSEVRIGSIAGQGGTQRLPRAIPSAVAMKMLLTGERIDAAEALRVGLVSDVYPEGELQQAARELADKISSAAPLSVRAAKVAATNGRDLPLRDGLLLETQLGGLLRDTEDRLEGRAAFAEKRKPAWKGR